MFLLSSGECQKVTSDKLNRIAGAMPVATVVRRLLPDVPFSQGCKTKGP